MMSYSGILQSTGHMTQTDGRSRGSVRTKGHPTSLPHWENSSSIRTRRSWNKLLKRAPEINLILWMRPSKPSNNISKKLAPQTPKMAYLLCNMSSVRDKKRTQYSTINVEGNCRLAGFQFAFSKNTWRRKRYQDSQQEGTRRVPETSHIWNGKPCHHPFKSPVKISEESSRPLRQSPLLWPWLQEGPRCLKSGFNLGR